MIDKIVLFLTQDIVYPFYFTGINIAIFSGGIYFAEWVGWW